MYISQKQLSHIWNCILFETDTILRTTVFNIKQRVKCLQLKFFVIDTFKR